MGRHLTLSADRKGISGGDANTTNNRMELSAVIEALQTIR
ncbi:hypothetical protein OBE_02891, partial [human gut metagenome]